MPVSVHGHQGTSSIVMFPTDFAPATSDGGRCACLCLLLCACMAEWRSHFMRHALRKLHKRQQRMKEAVVASIRDLVRGVLGKRRTKKRNR
eukprot:301886-Pelagomonas_calceolata.AAC.4